MAAEPTPAVDAARYLTPPELARRWRMKRDRVLALIRSGALRAFDASKNPGKAGGRPRWRISPQAIAEFEAARAPVAPDPEPARRPRRQDDYIKFY
jgi:hypothetical protein